MKYYLIGLILCLPLFMQAQTNDSISVNCKYNGEPIDSYKKLQINIVYSDSTYCLEKIDQTFIFPNTISGNVKIIVIYKRKSYIFPIYPYNRINDSTDFEIIIAKFNRKKREEFGCDYNITLISSGIGASEKGFW